MTGESVLELRGASLRVRGRTLFADLDLDVRPGELVAVIGPNGAGKTSLFRAVLGLEPFATGGATIHGAAVRRGDRRIGYVPQQRVWPRGTPMLGRDLVMLGRNGDRFGLPFASRADREAVERAIWSVRAEALASRPVGDLSGGEQQRLRIAQAIVDEPELLLLDEPLSSLDLGHQAEIVDVVQGQLDRGAAVMMIVHDVNPILGVVDRILYLAHGRHRVGTVDEVLTSESLTAIYRTPVEAVRVGERVFVAGIPDDEHHHLEEHEREHETRERTA